MASEIIGISSSIQSPTSGEPKSQEPSDDPLAQLVGPRTTVTPKTDSAPRGKIFEDEARETVFWEVAESSEDEIEGDEEVEGNREKITRETWGNTFKVEWIKWFYPPLARNLLLFRDVSLPFQRTRLLRNPWNGNREIKISRDGTELEPSIGARLLREFNDAEQGLRGSGVHSPLPGSRRMSYPFTPFRQLPPTQAFYQQHIPQIQGQGMTYFQYTQPGSQPPFYHHAQAPGMSPQVPQQLYDLSYYHPGQQPPAQHPRPPRQ
jgi:YT521-B-like domain